MRKPPGSIACTRKQQPRLYWSCSLVDMNDDTPLTPPSAWAELKCKQHTCTHHDTWGPEKHKVTCGVLHGSILGPLLFLIYVNDMSAVVNNKLLLYADVSAILVTGKDRLQIEKKLSKELQSVREWLVDNKLSLYLGENRLFFLIPNVA